MRLIRRAFALGLLVSAVSALGCLTAALGGTPACNDACKVLANAKCPGLSVSGDVDSGCSLLCAIAEGQDPNDKCTKESDAYYNCQKAAVCEHGTKCATQNSALATCISNAK